MLTRSEYGEIIQLSMGKEMWGQIPYAMSVFYVDGLLIDTGPFTVFQEAAIAFKDLPVRQVINTHHHEDHVGNNTYFSEQGLPILAHELAVPLIVDPTLWTDRFMNYQKLLFDYPPASPCRVLGEFIDGNNYRFQVIHSPGHSHDHICLLEPQNGWLFTGDVFRGEKGRNFRVDEDFYIYMATLERLLDYEFDTIFCCSGVIFDNAKQRVQNKLAYWRELRDQVFEMTRQGCEPEEIRAKLLGEENVITQFTEGDSSKINLVNAILKGYPND
ncbi:MAG: MBL fold metallo-hydrolase [Candidatus Saccharibacteria bacterium]